MKKSFLLALLASLSTTFAQNKTILKCGRLADVKTGKILKNQTIVINGNKIEAVLSNDYQPNGTDVVIDLSNQIVMPGLLDMHVHLEHETNAKQYLEEFTLNEADIAFKSVQFAKKTLLTGFTTVRDLGGTGVNIALRNAIDRGTVEGPRVFTAGKAIASTGGHADPTNGYRKNLMGDPGPNTGVANGTELHTSRTTTV
jgi:imidazolonepropionase-like amidohydrolase